MTESLNKLRELTALVFDKQVVVGITEVADITDEYGQKIFIIQTVDQKLGEAKVLIKDAQDALASVKSDAHDNELAAIEAVKLAETALIISDGKDARIKSLVEDLKKSVADLLIANTEIKRISDKI